MADLDTRAKRESVIGGHLFFLRLLPLADGSDAATEAERAHLAGHYNGIATGVPTGRIMSSLVDAGCLAGKGGLAGHGGGLAA